MKRNGKAGNDIFPRLKLTLKGNRFDDISDIQLNVKRFLNSIPKEDFLHSFHDMYSSSQWCIVMGGDYFKEQRCGSGSLVVKVSDCGWLVTSSSPVPLKARRVGERNTLNLLKVQTSSRWCGVEVRSGGANSSVILVT
ncbi:hypothetical protein TNCV_2459161 [Trichonephila clavipes]|nr:hypothetical protein TNCV_2459161 [Trichonephila clavipes]